MFVDVLSEMANFCLDDELLIEISSELEADHLFLYVDRYST